MDRQELIQRLTILHNSEAEHQKKLVDPVSELLVAEETLARIHDQAPLDADAAQATMTNMVFLRRVIRDLTIALVSVKQQIKQTELDLRSQQDSQQAHSSYSHFVSDADSRKDGPKNTSRR